MSRILAAILPLLLAAGIIFAAYGGGGSGGGGGTGNVVVTYSTPQIFITGACANKPLTVSVSINGAAFAGATVQIDELSSGSVPSTVSTGSTDYYGIYTFTPTAAASYMATVSGPNAKVATSEFAVADCSQQGQSQSNKTSVGGTASSGTGGSADSNYGKYGKSQGTASANAGMSLSCGDYPTMTERIKCRLELSGESISEILLYVPEECRVLNGTARQACLQNYDSVQKCRHLSADYDRNQCYLAQKGTEPEARAMRQKAHSIGANVSASVRACNGDSRCRANVRENVFAFVKFRVYNLEEKAEKLMDRGSVTEDQAIAFILKVEEAKLKFNSAATVSAKVAILHRIQDDWVRFRAIASENASAGNGGYGGAGQ